MRNRVNKPGSPQRVRSLETVLHIEELRLLSAEKRRQRTSGADDVGKFVSLTYDSRTLLSVRR